MLNWCRSNNTTDDSLTLLSEFARDGLARGGLFIGYLLITGLIYVSEAMTKQVTPTKQHQQQFSLRKRRHHSAPIVLLAQSPSIVDMLK